MKELGSIKTDRQSKECLMWKQKMMNGSNEKRKKTTTERPEWDEC